MYYGNLSTKTVYLVPMITPQWHRLILLSMIRYQSSPNAISFIPKICYSQVPHIDIQLGCMVQQGVSRIFVHSLIETASTINVGKLDFLLHVTSRYQNLVKDFHTSLDKSYLPLTIWDVTQSNSS